MFLVLLHHLEVLVPELLTRKIDSKIVHQKLKCLSVDSTHTVQFCFIIRVIIQQTIQKRI